MTINQHAEYILDNTDMSLEESDIPLDEIGKDLNAAMESLAALRGELDD